jgi:hypothetical protein
MILALLLGLMALPHPVGTLAGGLLAGLARGGEPLLGRFLVVQRLGM